MSMQLDKPLVLAEGATPADVLLDFLSTTAVEPTAQRKASGAQHTRPQTFGELATEASQIVLGNFSDDLAHHCGAS